MRQEKLKMERNDDLEVRRGSGIAFILRFRRSVHMYLQTAKPIYNVIVILGRPEAEPERLVWSEPGTDVQSIIHECLRWQKLVRKMSNRSRNTRAVELFHSI